MDDATGTDLLERDAELAVLDAALRRAAAGSGSVVLISGEAGIGKTSVVRHFVRTVTARGALLQGACDDLLTPRTLGPLRDAVRDGRPLERALAEGDRDAILVATLTELAAARPTVLVVEDVHWADDATLDVLRYVGVGSTRSPRSSWPPSAAGGRRPCAGCWARSAGRPCTGWPWTALPGRGRPPRRRHRSDLRALFALTAGNPFYVSEVVAAGAASRAALPGTVVDAVLARVRLLDPAVQRALEQLAVVPTAVELPLARALLGDLGLLAQAEERGVVAVTSDAVAFRHELARHVVEDALPASARMALHAAVLAELLAADPPDLPRVVHHAVEAGDDAAVVAHAPLAAQDAYRAGAHAQEIRLYEEILRRRALLAPRRRRRSCRRARRRGSPPTGSARPWRRAPPPSGSARSWATRRSRPRHWPGSPRSSGR